MSVFERLQFNFDSDNFGPALHLPEESVNALKITTSDDLFTWQKDRLAQNTPIQITEYRQNPFDVIFSGILNRANDLVANTGVDYTGWVSGDTNPALLYTASQNLVIELGKFRDHLGNLAGVSTFEEPSPNVPTYDTATSYGRQAIEILYQTDEISNATPILGSFTSLYISEDLEELNSTFYTAEVNSYLINPAAATTQVVTGLTANVNSLITLMDTRRVHDETFFLNIKNIVSEYSLLKSLGNAGRSNTELSLINDFIGTDLYKGNLRDQNTEDAQREYDREYVPSSGFGTGSRPPPVREPGADTDICTIPDESPQLTYNFVVASSGAGPGGGGPGGGGPGSGTTPQITCSSGSYNYFWSFHPNQKTNDGPSPWNTVNRWFPQLSQNQSASIKIPALNSFKSALGWTGVNNPNRVTIGYSPGPAAEAGVIVCISECPGNFTVPIPGQNRQEVQFETPTPYGSIVLITNSFTGPRPPGYIVIDPSKNYYINFKYQLSATKPSASIYWDIYAYSDGGQTGGPGPGGGGTPPGPNFSANFTPVSEIINIPVLPVPAGTEAYLFHARFLPKTWGNSAQDTYNREMSLGLSSIYEAYYNALPPATASYGGIPPATGPNDPRWVYAATQQAYSWIQFNGVNPFG